MGNIVVQAGETYQGWEILAVEKTQFGGTYYKVKCSCGVEKTFKKHDFIGRNGYGCRTCSNASRRALKMGDILGSSKVIDYVKNSGIYGNSYVFECLVCQNKVQLSASKKASNPNCRNCSQMKAIGNQVFVGNKYGKLTVIENRVKKRGYQSGIMRTSVCECECGKISIFQSTTLVKGKVVSCRSCAVKKYYKTKNTRPKLSDYGNPYLNYCITPKTMDDIIEHFGKSLEEIQDILMDLMLEDKIEQNKELLWETK